MLSKIEGRRPLWSITTAVCGVFISLIVFFNCCAWIVAAYRPETGADVIQSWYDWAWFAFLLGWIYLVQGHPRRPGMIASCGGRAATR